MTLSLINLDANQQNGNENKQEIESPLADDIEIIGHDEQWIQMSNTYIECRLYMYIFVCMFVSSFEFQVDLKIGNAKQPKWYMSEIEQVHRECYDW